jgi:enterochelin esterase-like enzyme
MKGEKISSVVINNHTVKSDFLKRDVKVDCYLNNTLSTFDNLNLLLVNDGQDLVTMKFGDILDELYDANEIAPLMVVSMHCSADRRNEYGTAKILDYKGRGAKAALYTQFVFGELLPFIRKKYSITSFKDKSFAGFSLGGLCALDVVWNHPHEFTKTGVFSGSLWWRDKDQADPLFNEETDRIMHRQIKEGSYSPWLKFFFEVGTLDETADRNNNGIIDSIDDTLALVKELENKGYHQKDIQFLQIADGRHDVATWAKAFPAFLKWGWGK